jgi:hypothetical protein
LCFFVAYFEAALRAALAVAVLHYRCFDNLGYERFRQVADFRMNTDRRC